MKKKNHQIKRRKNKQVKRRTNIEKRIQIEGALMTGLSNKKISKRLKVGMALVASVKKNGAFLRRKTRKDKGISKKITKSKAKILKKLLKGKKGVGIKKLAENYDFSGKTIWRWLHQQPWGHYLKYKKKPAPKNIEDRKLMVKKVRKFGIKKA